MPATFADHAMSAIDEFTPAREVLLNPYASEASVRFACEILAESTNWHDACAVRKHRLLRWSPSTDLTPDAVEALLQGLSRDDDYDDEPRVIAWACLFAVITILAIAWVAL